MRYLLLAAGSPATSVQGFLQFLPGVLDSEVLSTVPPNLLIASTPVSRVIFSNISNSAQVPGLTRSRT